ncbi:MAG: phosphatase PAP2 family protein [Lachnospiraceae bacterium]|nr:phosphatase PAP2 family protein [Lachnospiraceae bacterium]
MKTSFKDTLKAWFMKYKHGLLLLYVLIYMPWFHYLEKKVTIHFNVIHMAIDDYIPFIEFFIVPYFLWFGYVAFAVLYFFFKNKTDYYKLCAFLFTGMTVFLIVSTIYPNGHYLRPTTFARDNIFVTLVKWLYQTDTATNLFPSIHVYNSLGVHMAIVNSENFKNNKIARHFSFVLMASIILSTMFLKQHSVFDVITAFVMAAVMYSVVYGRNWQKNEENVLQHQLP